MNNGLPSLLEAIFGKKDLSSVSLDELNEVISEFPSFNAAHFLLSKKLKENGDNDQKENMRTALYFNNAFWLQTLLNEDDAVAKEALVGQVRETVLPEQQLDAPVADDFFIPAGDELDQEEVEILEEKTASEPEAVTSFDELMSKYQIETDETEISPGQEEIHAEVLSVPEPELQLPELAAQEQSVEILSTSFIEPVAEYTVPKDGMETSDMVLNEYGIFEEDVPDETDDDMEAFDPLPEIAAVSFNITPAEIRSDVPETIVENRISEIIRENSMAEAIGEKETDLDHEAFDRPRETDHTEFSADAADDTEIHPGVITTENSMPDLAARFAEQQRVLASFDAKKAEAIVFAPYHMIDYFASQGIKLVLEDQPADSFGKQLKSFTDWLKVMKKLPVQPLSEKADEKETDRIRHFAAHSVEERDILTESMAEVLAKQGMYENAIALYQKLSLIYPPKSAYFASRIEQLKATSS